jgi:hypothetical protein
MNFFDVELQQRTGFPIVKGALSIGSEANMTALGIQKHDRVLLPMQNWPNILFIWPVTEVAYDDHGFCDATLGESGLAFHGLRAQDIGHLSSPVGGQSFKRGGIHTGNLIRHEGAVWGSPRWKLHAPIHSYELKAEHLSDGLHFAISGKFAAAHDPGTVEGVAPLDGKAFSVDALIPREILSLKDFSGVVGLGHEHVMASPSNDHSPDRPRDPRSLRDLLIDRTLGSPLVRGRISLGPESALPQRRDRYLASFLHIMMNASTPESMSFSDAPLVKVFDDGFAWSSISIRSLTIAMLGRSKLEEEFDRRDSFSVRLAGDALGWVRYAIDETERVRPNLVRQQIRTMALRMTLEEVGGGRTQ